MRNGDACFEVAKLHFEHLLDDRRTAGQFAEKGDGSCLHAGRVTITNANAATSTCSLERERDGIEVMVVCSCFYC